MSSTTSSASTASPVLALLTSPVVGPAPDGPTYRLVDPALPHLRVDDLAATRGDGIFETTLVTDGHPQSLVEHMARFTRSARMLDLPDPAVDRWTEAIHAVVAAHAPVPELSVKTVLSRGVEGTGVPTGWAYAWPNADLGRERTEGIDVLLLDRGYPQDVAQASPWLLQGAKTLSYALNMAALRYARSHDADDVLFVSSDGWVLEGPNCTLVARFGDRFVTPPPEMGILLGTSQGRVFGWAEQQGFSTAYEPVKAVDLASADALWVTSSGRLAVPIRSVDGVPHPVDHDLQARLLEHLRTSRD